ncbi:PHA/PHB synthase family protein [Pedomonas mirosovicensis]|uniref:PHA/PHB synthase family protein n=1 Tax=Pedomonas mirosovicensis TaxID=2908641 RepID=UPI002168438D|nr:class I poly(R)-hydroxyalkanoic acid synthase [Pedomonas mirosovicensis]MCH8685738.1 class I poly(R)-hydroxyalkanoic acid synthase [Pedomonas mirosovicensis]
MGRAQQLMLEFWVRQTGPSRPFPLDPFGLAPLGAQVAASLMAEPQRLAEQQTRLWEATLALWQDAGRRLAAPTDAAPAAMKPDKRFNAPEWQSHIMFDLMRQSYLLASEHFLSMVESSTGLDDDARAKARFFARQWVDALSPANFPLTNPQVLKATLEEQGQNLLRGFENLLRDLEKGSITLTDESPFAVGQNVAATPGKVVFENKLFQLIQYAPATETVHQVPILIAPPWINKFYILDLTPQKSFVRWCVSQGFTVFVMSWVNPGSEHRDLGLADYMLDGIIAAMEAARKICDAPSVHAIGYCIAGTLLAPTLAWLETKGRGDLVSSATFFTAQVDFADAGDLRLFVGDEQLKMLDQLSAETGYLDARYMAATFNMLRANDLIWNYVVNNYLLGREPPPFDLLYWNSDATRLPRAMLLEYLRELYLGNRLAEPGGLCLAGVPIDLASVEIPAYIQAGREDHIAPPQSVYKLTRHFSGPLRFVLAGSGHIAGVVNPPHARKYQHWVSEQLPDTLEEFSTLAEERPGSWWPDWLAWLTPQAGPMVPARAPGAHPEFPALEDAPGRYVKMR